MYLLKYCLVWKFNATNVTRDGIVDHRTIGVDHVGTEGGVAGQVDHTCCRSRRRADPTTGAGVGAVMFEEIMNL